MPEVAQATITVTPVMAGAQEKITNDLTNAAQPAAAKAGTAAGKSMAESMSKKMTGAGTAMSKGVTAPIVAAGTAAVAAWKEVDTGLDTIVQKTGASGDALEEMHGILNNIATSIPTDFATAGSAIGEVNTRFGLTGDALEELSTKFVKFADLNSQDVSNSVDSVSKMLAGFGLSADDAGRMLDALNVVGQQTGVDVGNLADTVAANAKQFQEMGLTAEEAASFLGAASMAGLESSTAMMGLKTAMKNATADGLTLDEALGAFTETMQGNGDESEKLAAAYELFGTRAGSAIENAVENGTLDLDDFTASLGEFEGSVDDTFAGTKGSMDEFQTTLNNFKVLGAEIVEAAGPALTDILSSVAGAAEKLSDAWQSLSPGMQEAIIKIAGVAAVAGPLLLIVGKFVGTFATLKAALGGGGVIAKGLGSASSAAGKAAGPIASAGASFGQLAGQAIKMIAAAAALYIAAQAIRVLVNAAIEITNAGGPAIAVLAGMGAGIVGLMGAAAALGPALTAGAIGIGVFGAAMLGVGEGINLAATGISKIVDSLAGLAANVGAAGAGFEQLSNAVIKLTNSTGALDLGATMAAVAKGVKQIVSAANDAGKSASKVTTLSSSLIKLGVAGTTSGAALAKFGATSKTSLKSVSDSFSRLDLASGMRKSINDAISAASTGIYRLRTLFSGTQFSFYQHIKVPHFSMSGNFNAETGTVPTVTTRWYRVAESTPYLFTQPTLFGAGEAGDEVLYGRKALMDDIKAATGGGTTINNYITINDAADPQETANTIARELKMQLRMA